MAYGLVTFLATSLWLKQLCVLRGLGTLPCHHVQPLTEPPALCYHGTLDCKYDP